MTYALLSGNGDAIPGAAAARSFLSELVNRSPGARTGAELVKTKNKLKSEMLSAAVMPKLDAIPPSLPTILGIASAAPPIIDTVLPIDLVPIASEALIPTVGTALPPGVGGGGVIFPGGGSPGGGGNPPGTNPSPNPTVVSPVPEPSTWATMLFGFLLTGWAIRRRPDWRRWSAAHGKA